MAESILQKGDCCYICGRTGPERLDKHHIFGGANRNLSEKYGLTVKLCHCSCHIFGEYSVHTNAAINHFLQAKAQRRAMKVYGWTEDEFRKIFGKSYLDITDDERGKVNGLKTYIMMQKEAAYV